MVWIATTDEELRKVYDIFSDIWKFYKKFADVQQSDEYWTEMISESDAISKKHQDSRLCRDLILASVDELERKSKEMKQNAT